MSKLIISGNPLPNMPWEERPEGQRTPLWRCSKNPIIPRDLLPTSNSIFNSAVVPCGEGFAGVFRSRHSISSKTHSCLTTATVCSSLRRSTAASLCCHVRATQVTLLLATSSTASRPTWSSGDIIVTLWLLQHSSCQHGSV